MLSSEAVSYLKEVWGFTPFKINIFAVLDVAENCIEARRNPELDYHLDEELLDFIKKNPGVIEVVDPAKIPKSVSLTIAAAMNGV